MKGRDKRRRNKARKGMVSHGGAETQRKKGIDELTDSKKVEIYPYVDDRDRPDLRFGQKRR